MDTAVNRQARFLAGKRGLFVGVANDQSIATGCARAFVDAGADVALTYLNDKAQPHVAHVADTLDIDLLMPLDVEDDGQMTAVFERLRSEWGSLDFILHSVAFCPIGALHGRVVDCSRGDFARAMDVSVHSFLRMAKQAEPMMAEGGALLTVSYYGAEKVVDHYNIMGPVKAALEATTRYLAAELGPKGIRANAISPGPIATRAASGIDHFDALIDQARQRAPERHLVSIDDVGRLAAFLVSDFAASITGNVEYIDAGFHVTA